MNGSMNQKGITLIFMISIAILSLILVFCIIAYALIQTFAPVEETKKTTKEDTSYEEKEVYEDDVDEIENTTNEVSEKVEDKNEVVEEDDEVVEPEPTNTVQDSTENTVENTFQVGSTIQVEQTYKKPSEYVIGDQIAEGCNVIGFIEIPKIEVKFPIGSAVKKDSIFDVAICYMYGEGINKVGRTTFTGTNAAFERVGELAVGDTFQLLDENNETVNYEITEIFTTTPTDVNFMIADTENRECALYYNNLNDMSNRTVIIGTEVK